MTKDEKSSTFSITDNNDHTWVFYGLNYCFKNETSNLSIFFSQIESHWSFVLHSGWIKIDGKVIESIVHVKEEAKLEFDDITYTFESHMTLIIGSSQNLALTIICSDSKTKTRDQILNVLRNTFSYYESIFIYNILQYNKIFVVKDDIWSVDLVVYEEYGHDLISNVLLHEYYMNLELGVKIKIFNVTQTPKYNVIEVDDHDLDELILHDGFFEHEFIYECLNWVKKYYIFSSNKNNWKRKIKDKRYVKKKCLNKEKCIINNPVVVKAFREEFFFDKERSATPDFANKNLLPKKKKQGRSFSLIDKYEDDSPYFWTLDSMYKHDNT